jgi:hypothetical protein
MAGSTQQAVVVARVSFESTRLSPHCLAETYARIVPITRKPVRPSAKPAPEAAKARAEHG